MTSMPLAVGFALSLVAAGCSGDVSTPTHRVGPAGATLALPGGLSLEIPAGALSAETDIGVEVVTDLTGAGWQALPSFTTGTPVFAVSLTPHGTTFAHPVTLTMPFTGDPGNLVALRAASPTDPDWDAIGPIAFGDGVASVSISTFSIYTLIKAGTCPCFNGDDIRAFHAYWAPRVQSEGLRRFIVDYSFDSNGINQFVQAGYAAPNGGHSLLNARYRHHDRGGTVATCSITYPDQQTTQTDPARPAPIARDLASFAEFETCRAIVRAAETGEVAHQIAVAATGVPTGETLELALDGDAFTVAADQEVVFAPKIVFEGETYAVTITQQPASVECTLDAHATGTVGSQNVAIIATCAPPTTTPSAVAAACAAIDGLACQDATLAGCVDAFTTEREGGGAACHVVFDAVLTCVTAKLDDPSPSAGCKSPGPPGFELAFPSPCQTELDAWEACANPPATLEATCTAAGTLGCASFDQAGCVTELTGTRAMKNGGCTSEFDAWITCAEADPANALVCTASAPFFEAVSGGGSCSAELDGWMICLDP